ncbi:hypothetical protein YDYSY3_34270 [Paenibacillus chitinolyticus]|nr:hypothetical protein YDYSY3_34270 [Paenibacillus chitinolyticus]
MKSISEEYKNADLNEKTISVNRDLVNGYKDAFLFNGDVCIEK